MVLPRGPSRAVALLGTLSAASALVLQQGGDTQAASVGDTAPEESPPVVLRMRAVGEGGSHHGSTVNLGAGARRALSAAETIQIQEELDEAAERKAAEEKAAKDVAKHKGQEPAPDDASVNSTRPHILKLGLTKAKPCPENEDCFVHTMTNQRGNMHKELIIQLNRGRLGHHMFQWAASLSIAKELKAHQFRLIVREDEYEAGNTSQMKNLRSVAWTPNDFEFLQQSKQKCHVWDKMPLVIDSGVEQFNQWTTWGASKGTEHTPADFDQPDDGNLAGAVAEALKRTHTPNPCHIWELDGYFLNQGFFRHHIAMIRLAFWEESVANKAEDTLRWLLWNEKGAAVGIHIRFGDENFTGRNLPLQYYSDALQEVKKHNDGKPLACVIFSDKMDQAMQRSKHFQLCDSRIPMMPAFSDQKTFYMLSLLPNIVLADSVFSFWAARLSPNDPFVVSPKIETSASHLQQEYEYLTQTPAWVMVKTRLGPVGPAAIKKFSEEVEIQTEVPSGFVQMGNGYCKNGYYAGHVAADALDLKSCAMKCKSEPKCVFFALQRGKTCSRYSNYAGECDLTGARGQNTHVTFAKISDENTAMRGVVSFKLNSHKTGRQVLAGRTSVEEMTLEEVSGLEGYEAPESEWAY